MRRGLPALVLLLLLVSAPATTARAQEPIVRITATPEEVSVGEPVALEVTVLVPTWFPKPLVYPAFELTNTITRLPPDSSYPTNERFGRDTWSGIIRTYQIYPLIGATFRLSGQTMIVTYTDPEKFKPVTVEVDVPEVEFRAVVPTGAEALNPYLAGRRLTLDREVEGETGSRQTGSRQTGSLKVGDALVVRYTAELDGMPAIFLPTLVDREMVSGVPGVAVYAAEPVIEDGEPARRSEKLTLVFEAGGEFTVPGLEIRWWNMETAAVETASVPAMTISVAGPPIPSPASEPPPAEPGWPAVAAWAGLLAALLLVSRRWAPRFQSRWVAYRDRRRRSEGYAWGELCRALHGSDPRAAHHALLTWIERIEPGADARQFAGRHGDAKLQQQIEELNRSLYSAGSESVSLKGLEKSLAGARRRRERGARGGRSFALPPMNP